MDENLSNASEAMTDKLKGIHKEDYNNVQYKLWAEAIVSGKHTSESDPGQALVGVKEIPKLKALL